MIKGTNINNVDQMKGGRGGRGEAEGGGREGGREGEREGGREGVYFTTRTNTSGTTQLQN